jgi:DNA replicative helicase MCM subunit Mcm2 (Cdc46/Mcm family)
VDSMQCSRRIQARIGRVDMRVSVVFHACDVCVGEQTIPEDISPNVATTRRCCARAGAASTSNVRCEVCESKVIDERKMTAQTKNA